MAKDEKTISTRNDDGDSGLGPLAWLEDTDSPEELLPAWLVAKIDGAVARYGRLWTGEQTAVFRSQMAWTLATHPNISRLVQLASEGRNRGGATETPGQ